MSTLTAENSTATPEPPAVGVPPPAYGSHPMYHVADTSSAAIFVLTSGAKLTVARNPKGILIAGEYGETNAHIALSEEASEVLISALLSSRPDQTKPLPAAWLLPFENNPVRDGEDRASSKPST